MSSGTRAAVRPVVVVTRHLPDAVERELAQHFDVRLNTLDTPFDADMLAEAMRQADGLLCTVSDRVDARVLASAPRRVRIIANFGVGVDNIDLAAARHGGVVVTNTPGVLTEDTADLAIALMLAAARRVGEGERIVRRGDWTGWGPTVHLGRRVSGATLGIIGYGRIGQATARRAHLGFGMRVLYHQRTPLPPEARASDPAAGEYVESLAELLAASDFVSLHCPSTSETRGLMNAERLGHMQRGAVLVNTARGDIVDDAALAEALRDGHLSAAGLDVFAREPHVPASLLALEHVVLLPHLGSATVAAREAMGRKAMANLVTLFGGEEPPDRVA